MGGAAGGSPGGQKVLPTSSQSPAYILPGPGSGPVAVRSVWHSPMDGFGSLCPPNESPKSLLLITLSISNSFSPLPTSSSLSLSLSRRVEREEDASEDETQARVSSRST